MSKERRYNIHVIPWELKEGEELKSRVEEVISPEKKGEIFLPSIHAMRTLAQEHQITLPTEKVLLSRLLVVNESTYRKIVKKEEWMGISPMNEINPLLLAIGKAIVRRVFITEAANICLVNRMVPINWDRITQAPRDQQINLLQIVGIHELWHSLHYFELWESRKIIPKIFFGRFSRRVGIITSYPPHSKRAKPYHSIGLSLLQEGFIEHCAQETLKRTGELSTPNELPTYQEEMKVVNKLFEKIGKDPFFQASFTQEGFRTLFLALRKSGLNLKEIAEKMRKEHGSHPRLGFSRPGFGYPKTLKLIEGLNGKNPHLQFSPKSNHGSSNW